MGYYTQYALTCEPLSSEILYQFWEENENAQMCIDKDGTTFDDCKWYDHEDDILKFSKKYPDTLFVLTGIGEEKVDIWIFYAKNGKGYKEMATLQFPCFDENKLK